MKQLKQEKSLMVIGSSWISVYELSSDEYNRAFSNIQELFPLVLDKMDQDVSMFIRERAKDIKDPDVGYSFEDIEIHIGIQIYYEEE